MRLKKYLILLLDIILLLGCIGIVWLLGYLAGPQKNQGDTTAPTVISSGPGGGTAAGEPGDAAQEGAAQEDAAQEDAAPEGAAQEDTAQEDTVREDTVPGHTESEDADRKGTARGGIALAEQAEAGERERQRQACLEAEEEPYVPPTIMLASDLHYISSTAHDDGPAFWKMVAEDDGKLSQYSEEMIDALLSEAVERQPAALVLSGDLTLYGERINHERMAEKLRRVQEAGVPVVVIPGNHDIAHPWAGVYFGQKKEKAEGLETAADFLEIYHEFGYDQSPNRDPDSLSYVYPVDATHWLLMLDTCQYETGNHVNGRLKPETLKWLEVHLQVAAEHQIEVLPVGHHNLLSESRLYTTDCRMENHQEVAELLEKYQVPLYVSGHLHAQRIKKHEEEPGEPAEAYGIEEIVLGAYSIAPNQYGELYWNTSEDMAFTTKQADVAAYAAKQGSEDANLLNFREYAVHFVKQTITGQVMKKIYPVPDDLKEKMAWLYGNLYYEYCAGDKYTWDQVKADAAYRLWMRVEPDGAYMKKIRHMIEDERVDLHNWKNP